MLEIKMKAFKLSSRSSNPVNLSKAHNPFPITRLLGVSTLNSSAFYHNLWWEACWNFKIKFTEEGNHFTPSCNTRQTDCVQLKRLMLWKSRFLHRLWLFCEADRSVGFGGIWSQGALLHHPRNCLLSWLYMNTLFTSANSPEVMGLHQAKAWRKWCLPGVFSICKEARKERSRIDWEYDCNFSENFLRKWNCFLSPLLCHEKWHLLFGSAVSASLGISLKKVH